MNDDRLNPYIIPAEIMEIVTSTGCLSFYTLIDGKPVSECDMDKVLDHILPQVRAGIKDGTISFDSLVELFQYTRSETDKECCEQCGDCITRITYEI